MSGVFVFQEDAAPTPCRHCERWLRYVYGEDRWVDSEEGGECRPGLTHQPLPDGDDVALEIAQVFHPELFEED